MHRHYLIPNWPAPTSIKAYSTMRKDGYSQAPYDQFNLAHHVADDPIHVEQNRQLLGEELALPSPPVWINQVHGNQAINVAKCSENEPEADASYTDLANLVCIIMTADCLPILICNQEGDEVAAIHAGWKGLLAGVIDQTLLMFSSPNHELLAWLGPAIGPNHFEVNNSIREQYINRSPAFNQGFHEDVNQRLFANLYQLATINLTQLGVQAIYGGQYCTYTEDQKFYSYRRDTGKTGRMASLIWISEF